MTRTQATHGDETMTSRTTIGRIAVQLAADINLNERRYLSDRNEWTSPAAESRNAAMMRELAKLDDELEQAMGV